MPVISGLMDIMMVMATKKGTNSPMRTPKPDRSSNSVLNVVGDPCHYTADRNPIVECGG